MPVTRLDPDMPLPHYAHPGDAGADLCSTESFVLSPGERRLVPTGIAMALPAGWVGLIHPRSGLGVKHGVSMVNAPGTIDSGYRGEIKVCLVNTDWREPVSFSRGDRIAQLVIQHVAQAAFTPVPDVGTTARGQEGFGSTGVASGSRGSA